MHDSKEKEHKEHKEHKNPSRRCIGLKKNGEQCHRKTCAPSGVCPSHLSYKVINKTDKVSTIVAFDDSPDLRVDASPLSPSQGPSTLSCVECSVCFEKITEKPLVCGHYIHMDCIRKSMKAECPVCRRALVLPKSVKRDIDSNFNEAKSEWEEEGFRVAYAMFMEELSHFVPCELIISVPLCRTCLHSEEIFVES